MKFEKYFEMKDEVKKLASEIKELKKKRKKLPNGHVPGLESNNRLVKNIPLVS